MSNYDKQYYNYNCTTIRQFKRCVSQVMDIFQENMADKYYIVIIVNDNELDVNMYYDFYNSINVIIEIDKIDIDAKRYIADSIKNIIDVDNTIIDNFDDKIHSRYYIYSKFISYSYLEDNMSNIYMEIVDDNTDISIQAFNNATKIAQFRLSSINMNTLVNHPSIAERIYNELKSYKMDIDKSYKKCEKMLNTIKKKVDGVDNIISNVPDIVKVLAEL